MFGDLDAGRPWFLLAGLDDAAVPMPVELSGLKDQAVAGVSGEPDPDHVLDDEPAADVLGDEHAGRVAAAVLSRGLIPVPDAGGMPLGFAEELEPVFLE